MSQGTTTAVLAGDTIEARMAELNRLFDHAAQRPARLPGRNEACWCGSGKKYKRCHLVDDEAHRLSGGSSPGAGLPAMSENLQAVVGPVPPGAPQPSERRLRLLYTIAGAVWTVTRQARTPAALAQGLAKIKAQLLSSASEPQEGVDDGSLDALLFTFAKRALVTAPGDRRLVARVQVDLRGDELSVRAASIDPR